MDHKINVMRTYLLNYLTILTFVFSPPLLAANDSTKYYISLNYSIDLSDTYGGGDCLTGEFTVSRSWYGIKTSFRNFQSQSAFKFKVPIDEISKTLEIYVPEMSIMKTGSISLFLKPVQNNWIEADFVIGTTIGKAKSLFLKSIDYEYSLVENKFSYVFIDYQLKKTNHFGYHVGLDVTFNFSKKIGLQVVSRIEDLSNGGTFFLIGTGLRFRL